MSRDHIISELRHSMGEIPSPETTKAVVRAKIYMYYKLRQAYVTNWGSFVLLQIRANIVTNWAAITNQGDPYHKIVQLLQIGAKFSTNWGKYFKLGQLDYKLWHNMIVACASG